MDKVALGTLDRIMDRSWEKKKYERIDSIERLID